MYDDEVSDIVTCKMCGALVLRGTRPQHLAWHARINARMLQPTDSQVLQELHRRLDQIERDLVSMSHR